ncbi:hypothetical protein BJV77DRAFT_974320 [Russula vinacea]|nr:hypothetical protein BJV77DRAFT_974320 [Russula vinacea]
MDSLVDVFELGFYHSSDTMDDTYVLHNFKANDDNLTILGQTFVPGPGSPMAGITLPPLHCYQLTLSGAFDWHYLQCVIRRFGTQAYQDFPNIRFFVHPFKTGDSDHQMTTTHFSE